MKVFNRAVKLGGHTRVINAITVKVLEYDNAGRVLRCSGVTVPTGAGYAKACLFHKTDAADGVKGLYENQGTVTVASFAPVGDAGAAFANNEAIVDNSGNELIQFGVVASAINQLKVTNSAAGNPILVAAVGGDTDISIKLTPKGAGSVLVGADTVGFDVQLFGATTGKSWLWDQSADKMIVTGTSTLNGDVTLGTSSGILSGTANGIVPLRYNAVQNAISTATAIGVTAYNTTINTTSGALALTLAAGTFKGQTRRVQMIVDNGDATLTFNSTSTIVFADVGDVAELTYSGSAWVVNALYNIVDGATAPVYTP